MVTGFSMWIALVVFGLLAYFVADMFVQKSFRVFGRQQFRECVFFLGLVAVSYGGVYGAAYSVEHYVPDEAMLESAYLYMNYPVEFEGAQIADVIAIHEEILSQGTLLQELVESEETEEVFTVSLIYHFKSGRKLERIYQLPDGNAFCEEIEETLFGYETEPDSFMKYLVGTDYAEITEFDEAQVEYESEDDDYVGHTLDPATAAKVYRALCADAVEGTLQQYNLRGIAEQEDSDMLLYFQYYHTTQDWEDAFDVANGSLLSHSVSGDGDDRDSRAGYLNISFGEDCTNLIDVLSEEGILDPEDF
jgi:ABC-2 type transport system permease protein